MLNGTGSPGGTYSWAKAGVSYGDFKEGRVLEFGTVERALTDQDGYFESSRVSTLLADVDGTLRGLWVGGALRNATVDYYIADLATLRASDPLPEDQPALPPARSTWGT